jgi:hypothetical protein
MAIKVIAQRREVKLGKNPGMKFVMRPDLYTPIQEKKVFSEASTHSGISAGVIKAAWDAAGEVIRRGPLRVTRYLCLDWERCASAYAPRRWPTWRT